MSTTPLPPNWNVPQKFRDRLGTHAGRQRAMVEDGHLLLILHAPPDPQDPDKRDGRLFWRDGAGGWRATGGGSSVGALRRHLDSYGEAIDKLEALVQASSGAADLFQAVRAATPLVHAARNQHRALQAAREGISADKDLISLRDLAYDLERAAELLLQHARDALDFTIARRAEEQAAQGEHMVAASHRLNMLAAMFLPITALGSLLSMGIDNGLSRLPAPLTFWVIASLALAVGFWIRSTMPGPSAGK